MSVSAFDPEDQSCIGQTPSQMVNNIARDFEMETVIASMKLGIAAHCDLERVADAERQALETGLTAAPPIAEVVFEALAEFSVDELKRMSGYDKLSSAAKVEVARRRVRFLEQLFETKEATSRDCAKNKVLRACVEAHPQLFRDCPKELWGDVRLLLIFSSFSGTRFGPRWTSCQSLQSTFDKRDITFPTTSQRTDEALEPNVINVTNETNATDGSLTLVETTSSPSTTLLETSSSATLVQSSTSEWVVVEGEMAVVSALSRATGLSESRIRSSAQSYAKLRRLSGIWRVNFEIDTLPSEEAVVTTQLQQLKNSEDFAEKLKEELELRGGEPGADFNVSLDLSQEGTHEGGDSSEIIIIVAAVIACLVMLAALEDVTEDSMPPLIEMDGAGNAAGAGYANGSDGDAALPEPNSLAVGVGSTWGGQLSFFPAGGVIPERELSDPPLPPPAESPPAHAMCSEVPETPNPITPTDVHPEISGGRPQAQWTLVDQQLNQTLCQTLSPSCWSGSLVWTELPHVHQTVPLPLSKEYKLNFQRAGRLAGHCYDTSSQYKITGKYRESGELTWREVPQSSGGMAIECQGHLQMRALRGATKCSSLEIVGVFSAVSTSISARHLGSGRFTLTTSVQPTPASGLVDDEDSRSNFETPSPGAASSSRNETPTHAVTSDRTRRQRSTLAAITAAEQAITALTRLRSFRGSDSNAAALLSATVSGDQRVEQ
eukprot:s99_g13.t1